MTWLKSCRSSRNKKGGRCTSSIKKDKAVAVLDVTFALQHLTGESQLASCFVYVDAEALVAGPYLLRGRTRLSLLSSTNLAKATGSDGASVIKAV